MDEQTRIEALAERYMEAEITECQERAKKDIATRAMMLAQTAAWERDKERHTLYLDELRMVEEHRLTLEAQWARNEAQYERIATALETFAEGRK